MEKIYNEIIWKLDYLEDLSEEKNEMLNHNKNKEILMAVRELLKKLYV